MIESEKNDRNQDFTKFRLKYLPFTSGNVTATDKDLS